MRRITSLLVSLAIVLAISGSASAGHWNVVYDLAPNGSTLTTTTLFGPKVDPITGTFTIQYDATSSAGPITGARMVAGQLQTIFNQIYTGFFTITGTVNTTLLPVPPLGGTPGGLSGATLTFPNVGNSNITGFNHCNEVTISSANCGTAGFTASVQNPLTPTANPNPWPVPNLVFGATAGVGDFTSTTKTDAGGGATLQWVFKGKEISRVWQEVPPVPALSDGGRVGLGLVLLLAGTSAFAFSRGRRA